MIFHQIPTGGCQSYLLGCPGKCAAVLIDPALSQLDRYVGLLAREGLRLRYVVDTHTHADHFSAARQIKESLGVPAVMHRDSMAPYADMRLDDGDMLNVGDIRIQALHTPGHTSDSMCLVLDDRVFTGDTLLIGGTGRTDLPTGDPDALYDSLFDKLLKLDPEMQVFPAHDYKGRQGSTIGREIADNPRLQKRDRAEFVEMMNCLNLSAPDHMTAALRANMCGGKTVEQLLSEAAANVPFMAMDELRERLERRDNDFVVLDVRERAAYDTDHIPGRPQRAARPARAGRRQGASRSDAADRHGLRIWPDLDPGRGDPARARLPAHGRARRRHENVARGRLSGRDRRRPALAWRFVSGNLNDYNRLGESRLLYGAVHAAISDFC